MTKKNKIKELKAKLVENEGAIDSLKEDCNRLEREKDEALKQARKDHEERLKEMKRTIEANEGEKMENLREDNDKRRSKINEKYEREINERNEKISNLKRRLDLSEKEKKN